MGRHGNDRDAGLGLFGHRPDGRHGLVAVEHGHLHVHQHDVEILPREQVEGLPSVFGDFDAVPALAQRGGGHLAISGRVLGQQDPQRAVGGLEEIEAGRDWGLGIGDWGMRSVVPLQSPIPNRQSLLLPNPQSRSHSQRDGEGEPAPGAKVALDFQLPAHQLDEPVGDRQPQAGAAVPPRGRGVGLGEGGEDPRLVFRGDADPGVGDRKSQLAILDFQTALLHPEPDFPDVGEPHGVADQIHQHLAEPQRVAHETVGHVVGEVAEEFEPLLVGVVAERLDRLLNQVAERETRPLPTPSLPPRSARSPGSR